jgi:signal transduction histidine kinase
VLPRPLPAALAGLPDGPHTVTAGDDEFHVLALPAAGGRLVVSHDTTRNEARVDEFAAQVAVLGLAFVALAAVIARVVAGWLVAPLEQVARLLDHWAPAAAPGSAAPVDEEKRVFDAFQRVQLRWEQGLAAEGERIADLHHELRTPLAALRTYLEMLQAGAGAPPAERLQRCLAAVDALAGTLASLRPRHGGPGAVPEDVRLADCVADAWASLGELPARRALALDNTVPPAAEARLDRQALMTILRNLFRNAAEHAAPATLRVALQGDDLVVEDDGPGIAPADLAFVFERYYRGRLADSSAPAEGQRGLGLAIARQVAEANGWRLGVAPGERSGTRFLLSFHGIEAA